MQLQFRVQCNSYNPMFVIAYHNIGCSNYPRNKRKIPVIARAKQENEKSANNLVRCTYPTSKVLRHHCRVSWQNRRRLKAIWLERACSHVVRMHTVTCLLLEHRPHGHTAATELSTCFFSREKHSDSKVKKYQRSKLLSTVLITFREWGLLRLRNMSFTLTVWLYGIWVCTTEISSEDRRRQTGHRINDSPTHPAFCRQTRRI